MTPLRELELEAEDLTFGKILQRQARRNGDRPYLLFENERYSYGETDRETNRIANGLIDCGIGQGDHVAIMVGNCTQMLLVQYALGKIGAVICPINTAAKGDFLAYYLTHSDSVAFIVGTESLPRYVEVAERAPRIRRVVVVDEKGTERPERPVLARVETVPYEALRRGTDRAPAVSVSHLDTQGIFYTSGTTGPAKGVVASNAQSFAFSIGRVEYMGYWPDDILYTCLPLFHGNAMYSAAIAALLADAQVALSRRFSTRAFWSEVRRFGATQFNLLGSMVNILWAQPSDEGDRDHRVRLCGTVPMPLFAPEFERRFGVPIVTSYASTDFGQGTFLQPGYPPAKFRSAGKPRPGVEIEIRDNNDIRVTPGVAGEICFRTDDPSLGGRTYYKMPEVTAAANRGGWFHSGDRGYIDADGYVYFVDRIKDAIRRRGENISSWEVEQVIANHSAVLDVAVFAVSSDMSEDEVMASIVLRPGHTLEAEALVRHCESNMPYFMVPRFVEFVPRLPRTMSEKVQKSELRASAEARLSNIWDREKAGIVLSR